MTSSESEPYPQTPSIGEPKSKDCEPPPLRIASDDDAVDQVARAFIANFSALEKLLDRQRELGNPVADGWDPLLEYEHTAAVPQAPPPTRLECEICGVPLSEHGFQSHGTIVRTPVTHRRWTFPEIVIDDGFWREEAACWDDQDPRWSGSDHLREPPPELAEICNRCGVKIECLAFAIKADIRGGIWGGTTPRGRKRYRKR